MAILQVYQADLLVKNFAKATELALHATKQTSCSIGHSMAALVIMERHLWLNLSGKKKRSGLFVVTVNSIVSRYQAA